MTSEIIRFNNGDSAIISYGKSDFNCPICQCLHDENDWYEKYAKAKGFCITIRCKGCKRKLGLAVGMMSDVHVWDKATEKPIHSHE